MSGKETTLEELLVSTAGGDREAFATLYERTNGKLFGIILRILKSRQLSEDVLQDVYLKVWRKAGTYNAAKGKPISWMATIARNRAIDLVRASRPETTLEEPGAEEEVFHLAAQKAAGVDPAELETLRTCLGEMQDDDRHYVLLAYYDGFSREELSQRFKIPVGTIKTRLRRGLIALRNCLEKV